MARRKSLQSAYIYNNYIKDPIDDHFPQSITQCNRDCFNALDSWQDENLLYSDSIDPKSPYYNDHYESRLLLLNCQQFIGDLDYRLKKEGQMDLAFEFLIEELPRNYTDSRGLSTPYSKRNFFRLHKWAVFGTALRLANETFNILPINFLKLTVRQQGRPILKFSLDRLDIDCIEDLDGLGALEIYLKDLGSRYKYYVSKGLVHLKG